MSWQDIAPVLIAAMLWILALFLSRKAKGYRYDAVIEDGKLVERDGYTPAGRFYLMLSNICAGVGAIGTVAVIVMAPFSSRWNEMMTIATGVLVIAGLAVWGRVLVPWIGDVVRDLRQGSRR